MMHKRIHRLPPRKKAIIFVVFMGFISLFADMTYEGARSITGPYLGLLGASGLAVSVISGFGEFIGYAFRLIFGYLSDRKGKYWTFIFVGYFINLFAVPLLALTNRWEMAAALIIAERFGKSIRNPSKEALLSYATKQTGRGWGFGLHKAMDQIGAIIGPLIVTLVLYLKGGYKESFAVLIIPALCAIAVLVACRMLYPRPQELEIKLQPIETKGYSKKYWFYIAAVSLVAVGYVDFPLIAYHMKKVEPIPEMWIPVFYSIAMAIDGLSALIMGRLFDKRGLSVLFIATMLSSFFAFFAFSSHFFLILLGMILWGIGMGSQESIMRAYIGSIVAMDRRATAYGTLNFFFGSFWLLGSAMIGYLYDVSLSSLIFFSVAIQLLSLPFFVKAR